MNQKHEHDEHHDYDEHHGKYESALKVNEGIEQPPVINRSALKKIKRKKYTIDEYVNGIIAGDRIILSRAITMVESSLKEHQEQAHRIVNKCLPFSGKSIRIGITGVPGVGKSTFIETFGKYITSLSRKLAVLAIDPSSERSKGSILGDKTRMEDLATDPNAFIRPSPSAGTLGGVARKTRESLILCEAAGFDTIFIETVGVGQSETAVQSMVDFFLLLMLAGAGDELQGIKRGIMEMADGLIITKADGDNKLKAEQAKAEYQNALHLFPRPPSGWLPKVLICSALKKTGIEQIWKDIYDYTLHTKVSNYFSQKRQQQAKHWMYETINEFLQNHFYQNPKRKKQIEELEQKVLNGQKSSFVAANEILAEYFNPKKSEII